MRKPLLISLFLFFCMFSQGFSGTVYWNSTSVIGIDLASNASAWSGGVTPATNDNVTFNATSTNNCTWDLGVALRNFSIDSGYTGTIANAASTNWNTTNYVQVDGTFTGDASSNMTVTGNFTYSGGTITANTLNLVIDSPANISNTYTPLYLSNFTANANVTVSGTQAVGAQSVYISDGKNITILTSGTFGYNPISGSVFSNLGTIDGAGTFLITTSGYHTITFGNVSALVWVTVPGDGQGITLGNNTVLGSGLTVASSGGGSYYYHWTFDSGAYNLTVNGAFNAMQGWPTINQNQTWNIGGGINLGDGATAYPYNPTLTQKGNINTTYFSWIPYMGSSGYAGTFTGDSSFNLTLSDNFTFPDSACYYSGACGTAFSWPNINLVMTGTGKTLAFRPATPTNAALNSLTVLGDITLLNTVLTMNNLTIAGSLNLSGNRAVSAVNLTLLGSGKLNVLTGSLINITMNGTRFWVNGGNFSLAILSSIPPDGLNAVNLSKYLNISDLGGGVFDINISYTHSDLGNHSESSLGIYEYTGSDWVFIPSTVDSANDIVYASSIASFSPFAVMSDITIPNLDGFKFSVPNMIGYSAVRGYQFNATVTDGMAVDDVWIEHNFTGTLTNYSTSGTTTCYQESADVSTACGGLSTGGYDLNNDGWLNPANSIDGDWSTYLTAQTDSYLRINYTKPNGVVNVTWTLKDGGGVRNFTLPHACWNSSTVGLWVSLDHPATFRYYCNQGGAYDDKSGYYYIGESDYVNYFYEEAMWWNISQIVNVSSTYIYNYGQLAAGYYQFQWWANDTSNNLNSSDIGHYQVNQSYLPPTLYINGSDADSWLYNISVANFTANFSSGNSFPITLYTNLTGTMELWDTQNSPLVNLTNLSAYPSGNYAILANWTGNENYTYSQANHSLNLQETVILAKFAYPADATTNSTHRTIEFAWNATFYGGNAVNCSLWDNHTGSWMFTQANTSAVINNAINTLYYSYPIDYPNISWSVQCYDSINRMNFTDGNRTLGIALNRNSTAINMIFPTSVYQNSENQVKANITDLITNLSVTFGTMSINLTKADGTSLKENMTYDSAESLWLSGNHTFDVQGLWTLVLDYYGEDLFANSTNSSNVTVNVVPVGASSVAGGGGSGNCYYNWTCSEWTPAKCPGSGKQTRQCVNTGTCLGTLGKPLESQSCEYTSPIPKQLLDVKLTLESNRLIDSTKLTSLTTFQSFGKTPAEVNLTYTFLDSSGKQIYNETDQRTVYTELALQRKFGKLVLGAGNYSLVLVLQYVNVTEKFRQDFEVLPTEMQQAFLAEGGFGIYVLAFSFVLAFIFAFYSYQLMTKFKKDKSEIEKLESETEEPKQKQIRFK